LYSAYKPKESLGAKVTRIPTSCDGGREVSSTAAKYPHVLRQLCEMASLSRHCQSSYHLQLPHVTEVPLLANLLHQHPPVCTSRSPSLPTTVGAGRESGTGPQKPFCL